MEKLLSFSKILLIDTVFSILIVLILTIVRFADKDGYAEFINEYAIYAKFDTDTSMVLDGDISEN